MRRLAYEWSFGRVQVDRTCWPIVVDMTAQRHWIPIVEPMSSEQINNWVPCVLVRVEDSRRDSRQGCIHDPATAPDGRRQTPIHEADPSPARPEFRRWSTGLSKG